MKIPNAPLLVCLVVVGAVGVAHGIATDRWQPSSALKNAVSQMDNVPVSFGDWVGEDEPFAADDMSRGGVARCIYRSYRNTKTKATVSVLLVCGRGGPICAHSPEVCYSGAGYELLATSQPKEFTESERKDTFRMVRFGKPGVVVPTQLEIYWAWSRDGKSWDAPENPRLTFARQPAVYKLYVVREFSPSSRSGSSNPCQDFIQRALPELRQTLVPSNL